MSAIAHGQVMANVRFVMSGAAADVSGPGFGCCFARFVAWCVNVG